MYDLGKLLNSGNFLNIGQYAIDLWFTYFRKHVAVVPWFAMVTLIYQRVPWETTGAKFRGTSYLTSWVASLYHLSAEHIKLGIILPGSMKAAGAAPIGACPNGYFVILSTKKKTLTPSNLWSIVSSLAQVFLYTMSKSLSAYNLEHWMHEWGLTFSVTHSHIISFLFKDLPANITWNATRTNLIGSWNVLDLCTTCLRVFIVRQGWDSLTGCLALPAPCDRSSFHQTSV